MAEATLRMLLLGEDRSASKAMHGVGNEAEKTGGKLKGLGKMAKVGALGIAAAAGVAAVALVNMTKSAIADEKAQAMLAKTLKNSAGATKEQIARAEDYVTAMGKQLGVADDELRPALARLAVATGDVAEAQSLSMIAMNVSAGSGKSLKQVTEALAKAQNGNLAGLSKLGVATKDAEGKTKSLEQITAELAKTYAGAASTAANTTEGKFARLKLQFDETKEAIGARLIPIASSLADFLLTKMGPALAKAGAWAQENLLPPLRELGEWISTKVIPVVRELGENVLNGLRGFIDNVSKALQDNKPFIDALGDALVKVAEFIYLQVYPAIYSIAAKVLPLLGTAIGVAITVLKEATTAFLFLGEHGVRVFGFLLDAALGAFGGILKAASTGLGWIPGIGSKIKEAETAFNTFRTNTVNDLEAVATKLGDIRTKINDIPAEKTVHVNVVTTATGVKIPTSGTVPGQNNVGRSTRWNDSIDFVGEAPSSFAGPGPRDRTGGRGGDNLGTVTFLLKDAMTGEIIEQKLARVKRRDGGRKLAFEFA